ncbi:hypothetical protein G7L40_02280 [Paenibacillus polymyxa]|uniref:Uncharacterized protein n=1 Tax=Paenibacillus polymyxa TaxID=1406 RepID=A0A378XWL7_PAEPO|nr:hypothetical protein [Paenibacillus polymyxa]MBE7897531.1 hypothetical protein [Paenibacillus polymyxa]MBG9766190.1 hypothetical protein [Paenibacillus polymyxa]MCC3257220.1 hypothetical protein [Paenibacillus polymyxa]QPK51652.1 hypothetical protein G7035_02275 [Paenibacillus polymyxa]QPK56740.1 hypothetical protein G7L40_02280 [Paenibacillus polymyxa]
MTDKPRLIDADKLIKQLQDNRDLFAEDKFGSPSYNMGRVDSYHTMITWINNGHFDPDPPHHPDIQAESLIQQKDAEIERLKKIIKEANDENERLLSGEETEEYESALTELLKENTP